MIAFNPLAEVTLEKMGEIVFADTPHLDEISDSRCYRAAIEYNSNVIGSIALNSVNTRMRTATVGYSIDQNMQGQGLGGLAVRILVQKVFKETNMRKLMAFVHAENIASIKIL